MAFRHWGFTCTAFFAPCISDALMNGSTSLFLLLLAIMCSPIGNYAFVAVERVGVQQHQVPMSNSTAMASKSQVRSSQHNDAGNYKASGEMTQHKLSDLQQDGVYSPHKMTLMDKSISSHQSGIQLPSADDTQYLHVDSIRGGRLRLKRAKRSVSFDFKKEAEQPLLALLESLEKIENAKECTRPEIDLTFGSDLANESLVYYSSFLENSYIAVYAANLLNSFYSRQRSPDSIFYHEQMLYSIVRNIVENNPNLSGSCIAFDSYAFSEDKELFAPCTYYKSEDHQMMTEIDMGTLLNYTSSNVNATEWFTGYKKNAPTSSSLRQGWLIHRLNATTNGPTENASYAFVIAEDGEWTSPYFDCGRTDRWIVTYSVPFYNQGKFLGVVTVDVDLKSIDVNQCENGTGVFTNTHRCTNSTKCVFLPGRGLQNGAYECTCAEHYYFPSNKIGNGKFNGTDVENEYRKVVNGHKNTYLTEFVCLACKEGCDSCESDKPCFIENDQILRAVILAVQSLFIVLTILLIGIVLKYRSMKVINCDSPWMLVVVLIGAVLLYSELVAMYFEPCLVTCYLQRWLRGWGFAIAYGMLVLKIYRKLAIFQTRSATRVLVRDRDVLKWLFLIIIVFSGYLSAWTAFSVQNRNCAGGDVLLIGQIDAGMKFYACAIEWWDYVIEVVELLFLIFGIYLCYSVRGAPCEFHENRYISIAIYNETIISLFLYVSRHFVLETIAPDWMFLMYFLRSQLTTTVMVSLIFLPKLLVVHKMIHDQQFRDRVNSRVVFENKWQSFRRPPTAAHSQTNNIDTHNMNPEDVREELKRLYTQLEIYKTKSLKIDNPHLPKKRPGVKWRAPRRFSRGYSLRTHSGHSESERSSDIARSNESLTKGFELHDYRVNHVDPGDSSHGSQRWLVQ